MEQYLNPFKRNHLPSIFNEHLSDNKMDIPQNIELYENVIRSAMNDLDNDSNEGGDDMTDKQRI